MIAKKKKKKHFQSEVIAHKLERHWRLHTPFRLTDHAWRKRENGSLPDRLPCLYRERQCCVKISCTCCNLTSRDSFPRDSHESRVRCKLILKKKKKKKTKVRRNCANGEYMVKFWSKDKAFSNEIGIESRLIGRVVGHARGTRSRRSISKRDQWKRRPKRTWKLIWPRKSNDDASKQSSGAIRGKA